MLTFRSIVVVVGVLAVLLSIYLAYSNFKYAGALADARARVEANIQTAKAANAASARAEIAAQDAQAKAAVASKTAAEHAAKAKELEAQLKAARSTLIPSGDGVDTMSAYIASLKGQRDVAEQSAVSWRSAYESQLEATVQLQHAVDSLTPALHSETAASQQLQGSSQEMVNASHRSFFAHLIPKIGVGVSAGINAQGKPDAVAGVTMSWPL